MAWQGRSILAFFTRREDAEAAARSLRREGFESVRVDRVSRSEEGYGRGGSQVVHNPLTGDIGSLADLTLGTRLAGDDDAAVALAAHPAASGMAHSGPGAQGHLERAFLVTVLTTEESANRAVDILERHGGMV